MMDQSPEEARNPRVEVLAFLRVLSSGPLEGNPEELLRLWFDEIYIPSERYYDGLKGDFSPQAVAEFRRAFTAEESEVLARFHRFVELRLELLKKTQGGAAAMQESPLWEHLRQDAQNTLAQLNFSDRLER